MKIESARTVTALTLSGLKTHSLAGGSFLITGGRCENNSSRKKKQGVIFLPATVVGEVISFLFS
jgi:hypothetical protein